MFERPARQNHDSQSATTKQGRVARRPYHGLWAFGIALAALLIGPQSGQQPRATAVGAANYFAYLPLAVKLGYDADPAGQFLAVNGGPVDGINSSEPFPGTLAHYPALRAKSLYWMEKAGIHWLRNYSSDGIVYSWRFVEPTQGGFDWTAWDILAQEAQAKDVALLASIGNSVPEWASESTDWRDLPIDLHDEPLTATAWYQYVRAVVERYDGDGVNDMPGLTRPIKYWEMWNEADLRQGWNPPDYPPHLFNGDLNDYIRLSQVGYSAVKDADPAALVVGPATAQNAGNNGPPCYPAAAGTTGPAILPEPLTGPVPADAQVDCWLIWNWQQWMAAGGLDYVDIVSFNRYFEYSTWDSAGWIDFFFSLADANRGGKPVWLTETGWNGTPTVAGGVNKARNLVRVAIIAWERPFMAHVTWYDLQEAANYHGSNQKALFQTLAGGESEGLEPDPLFHPAHRAASVMARVLFGFTTSQRPAAVTINSEVRVYKFAGSGREVWVVWSRDDADHQVSIDTGGKTTRVIGLFGENLGTFAGGTFTAGLRPQYLTTDLDWFDNVFVITGRVSDGNNPADPDNGIANTTVSITGPVNAATMTDGDGNYVFEDLPEGTYTVSLPGLTTIPASRLVTLTDRAAPWGQTSFTVN